MKLSELMELNLQDIKQTTREISWKTRECHASMWIRLLGDREIESVTRDEVELWVRERLKIRADATVKAELNMLHRAYSLAVRKGLTGHNPAQSMRIRFRPVKRHQVLSQEDETRLRKAYKQVDSNGEILWLIEKFALLTGLRTCEQAWLRPCHIQGDLLEVPKEGKTGTRLVPLIRLAREIAQLWISIAREAKSDFIFFCDSVATNRSRAAEPYLRKVFRPSCELANLPGLQRRDLRRTFATRLINAGVPIFEVQRLLGHTTPNTTMIYAHVGMDRLRASVLALA